MDTQGAQYNLQTMPIYNRVQLLSAITRSFGFRFKSTRTIFTDGTVRMNTPQNTDFMFAL